MLARYGQHQPLLAQHLALERRVVEAHPAEADVDLPCLERLDLLDRGLLDQHQRGLRLARAEQARDARQRAIHGRRHEPITSRRSTCDRRRVIAIDSSSCSSMRTARA